MNEKQSSYKSKSKRKRLLDSDEEIDVEEDVEEEEEEEEEEAQDKLRIIQILSKCEDFSSNIKDKIDSWQVSLDDASASSLSQKSISSFVPNEQMQRYIHPDIQV